MSKKWNCIFCKIVNKEIPANVILENDYAISFLDVNPLSNGHTIVIPKKHHLDLVTCNKSELEQVISLLQETAVLLEESKLKPWGFNYLSNQGKIAGQEIMHFHFHIIPKYAKDEGVKFIKDKINVDPVDEVYEKLFKKIKEFNKYK